MTWGVCEDTEGSMKRWESRSVEDCAGAVSFDARCGTDRKTFSSMIYPKYGKVWCQCHLDGHKCKWRRGPTSGGWQIFSTDKEAVMAGDKVVQMDLVGSMLTAKQTPGSFDIEKEASLMRRNLEIADGIKRKEKKRRAREVEAMESHFQSVLGASGKRIKLSMLRSW